MRDISGFACFKLLLTTILFLVSSSCTMQSDNSSDQKTEWSFSGAPGSYSLKSDSDEIIIPFELYAGNKPMIIGEINGRKAKFLVDNGKLFNQIWFYNGEVDSLGLHYKSRLADSLIGIGKNDASQIFDGNHIHVDFEQVQFHNQPTLISPSDAGYASYFPGINGQVSSMFFKHFIVEFDFERKVLVLREPESFRKRMNQRAVKMQKRRNDSYCIPFELLTKTDSVYRVLLDIDLGTVFPLYLISNEKNKLPISFNAEKQFLGYGASGELYGFRDTLQELRFSNYILEDYPILIVKADSNADSSIVESGTFGIQIMKQFNITFDYFNEMIFFEPNKSFKGSTLDVLE